MPRRFDSFQSVVPLAKYLGVRDPEDGESLEDYRCAVAMCDPDKVEAMELRTGRPWNEFTDADKLAMLSLFVNRSKE